MGLSGFTVVYGGSFNPPHLGHQMLCLYLLEGLGAERVWIVPTFAHPFGKPLLDFSRRVELCELLARPFGDRVEVLRVEEQLGGPSRTFDTLSYLTRTHRDRPLALAVGADILSEVAKWHRWEDITRLVKVVVIGRTGFAPAPECPISLPNISSSDLRHRLAVGESVQGLIPVSIRARIAELGLYAGSSQPPPADSPPHGHGHGSQGDPG